MTTQTTTIEIPATPTVDQIKKARATLRQAGIDPRNGEQVAATCGYASGDNPPALLRALAIVTSQITCYCCQTNKLDVTDKDALGVFLCPSCYIEGGLENDHSDGHHGPEGDGPNADCPNCRAQALADPPAETAADADAAEEQHFAEWAADLDAAEADLPAGPDAADSPKRRGRPAAPKHDSCPDCGHGFSTPKAHCSNRQACERRQATRKAA